MSDGHIGHYDYSKQKRWDYDPKSRVISTSSLGHKSDNSFPEFKSISSWLGITIEGLTKRGGNVIERSGTYDGNAVRIYEVTFSEHPAFKGTNITFFIDPDSQLIIAEKVKVKDENGNILMEAEIKLDYPETGPASIYDLGVPKDTKIARLEKSLIEIIVAKIDSRENWPEPHELVNTYWQAWSKKNFEEMAIMWPGSEKWNEKLLKDEKAIEYVFGEVQETEIKKHIIVPYASKNHYEQYKSYNLKMYLSNKKSTTGRYYIVSGN